MKNKNRLNDLLDEKPPVKGKPLGLSTDASIVDERAQSHNRTIAPAQQLKTPAPIRTKRGYALREDLVKACKQIALDRDITLYEVMETAIEEYLERQKGEQPPVVQPSPIEQTQKPRAEVETPVPLPDDLVTLQAFADQHYVNRNEAERLQKTGAITAVKGTWTVGKQRVTVALDAKGRRDFWAQFHETQGFRACDDCPHSRV